MTLWVEVPHFSHHTANLMSSGIVVVRHGNTGLVSSGASFTPWGESVSLVLVGHTSSDGVMIKMPYGAYVLL